MIDHLDVMIWGRKAGTLIASKRGRTPQICFYYAPEFVETGFEIAPLTASIHSKTARLGLPVFGNSDRHFNGLPAFIADSMPDHWGNVVFQEWAKAHKIKVKELTPLDRLAYIGRRGMGALEFVPPTAEGHELPFRIEIEELSRLAQRALKEAKDFHVVMTPDFAIESLFKVGTSAGGRRPKAVVNVNLATLECYSGQVAPPESGFTPMIIKLDEHMEMPSTRIEYSYYLMAQAVGLSMMPSRLLEGAHETHFLTQRFDRLGNEKIHVQTLAAMNPLATSYEELFAVAQRLDVTPDEMGQLYLQMVMNVLSGNVDDHSKNFSFMLREGGKWMVSPAYDFTFTIDPSAPHYVNRHSLTIDGKNEDIMEEELMEVARQFNIKRATAMITKAKEVTASYRTYAEKAGVPELWIRKIEEEMRR